MRKDMVVWFRDVDKNDIALVGGKGANLGEMTKAGFPVPSGFIVTAESYYQFLRENHLIPRIKHLLQTVHFNNHDSLIQTSNHIKKQIMHAAVSEHLIQEVFAAYRKLGGIFSDALVAVRSSATAEDLPTASFAGQQATFLNVKGEANLLIKIKEAWASLFEPRAIFYRHEQHFEHFKVGIAVPVQKMVESEKSGVMFTVDPVTNDKSKIIIEAIYGLGEYIVQGTVTPDHYEVSKQTMAILNKTIAYQHIMYKKKGGNNKEIKVSAREGQRQKITDNQIIDLVVLGKKLEKHYYFPQDIEWAIEKKKLYIVQTRPITTIKKQAAPSQQIAETTLSLPLLLKGDPASPGIRSGPTRILHSAREIDKVIAGEVLVAPQTNPDFVPAMKKAVAIVTDTGGRTSHAAIVSRELGIPAVVGTKNGTKILKPGEVITVNGSEGTVYKGAASSHIILPNHHIAHVKTATKIYVNLAEPELAEKTSQLYVDGVGLLRAEFMMAGIGAHPKKLIKEKKKHVFINKLAEQIEMFCKAFHPRPVVYRTSDLKTNEYRQLRGGEEFEPIEPNPMLGFRGAYRYIVNPDVLELELEAIKIVRNKKNLKNLWAMIPFVRTVRELAQVKEMFSQAGLHRSTTFKLWMMVEIPSNVILLDEFIQVGIDGVSIGSNDLTMLILGTDRDNSEVARAFDEQNNAVLWALEKVIKTCNAHKITSSICGQAASVYPKLLERVIQSGITSVSVSPDAVEHTRILASEIEKKRVTEYGKD